MRNMRFSTHTHDENTQYTSKYPFTLPNPAAYTEQPRHTLAQSHL